MRQNGHVHADAVTTFFDGQHAEFFVVTAAPGTRELVTTEFYEQRPGGMRPLKQVNWGVAVPAADLFAATSGLQRDVVQAFWIGGRTEEALHALSIFQEQPIVVDVEPRDELIDPAVVRPSGQMDQYFWRPGAETWSLCRHVLTGEGGTSGIVETHRLLQTPTPPVHSAVAPVPGDDAGRVVVAWGAQADEALILRAVLQDEEGGHRARERTLHDTKLLSPQRLALHVGPDATTARLGGTIALFGGRTGIVDAQFDFAGEETTVNVTALPQPTEAPLHATQAMYYQGPRVPQCVVGMLDKEGTLAIGGPGRETTQVLRREVPLTYDLSFVPSAGVCYEAQVTAEGDVDLVPLS